MKWIQDMKTAIAKRIVTKAAVRLQRNRNTFHLLTTKTAGILYEASNTEDYELIKKYVNYLKEHGIKVKTIGYFSKKETPPFTFSKLEYEFFTKKELNWYLKPATTFTDQFVKQEYDLLIDLNMYDHLPLRYLAATSKAKFKIGKWNEDNKVSHDMMIEIDETKNLKYFLQQVDIYLQMISKQKPSISPKK